MRAHKLISKSNLGGNMEGGYAQHYSQAQEEFIEWYYKDHPNEEIVTLKSMMHWDEMWEFDGELKHAIEAFEDCEQVKIIYDYERREHCLKVKWEVNPWWPEQVLHFYYCVLLPIDYDVEFKTPFELAGGKKHE